MPHHIAHVYRMSLPIQLHGLHDLNTHSLLQYMHRSGEEVKGPQTVNSVFCRPNQDIPFM